MSNNLGGMNNYIDNNTNTDNNNIFINNINNNINNNIYNNIYNNINFHNNYYNILTRIRDFNNIEDNLDDVLISIENNDVLVSLDNNDLQNLKTYKNIKTNNINCCICMDNIHDNEMICELICNHQFHELCIKTYLDKYNYKCPLCRESAGSTKTNM